jgi:predicted transglutaminase-like cysteine proteinase
MTCWRIAALAVLLAIAPAAHAADGDSQRAVLWNAVHDASPVPVGWVDFCRRYPGECEDVDRDPQTIPLTDETFSTLDEVNLSINHRVQAVTDLEHIGMIDRWDLPSDGKGDCEDIALLKRKLLMARGLPRQALLMTVVWDLNGEGHAVLTAHTDRGDYILDNLSPLLRLWSATGYRFVKRQSDRNEQDWVFLDETVNLATPVVASR